MEENTLISVIIPAYNAAPYIEQCIENMLCQTYKNLEIIVVDDGSTDNTAEIVKKYPVKLIQQKNQGVSVARNIGIDAATGDYLHFMDVDDLINLNFYKNMLDAILSVDADMACCGVIHERLPSLTSIFDAKFIFVSIEDKMHFTNVGHQGQVYKYLFKTSYIRKNKFSFDISLRNSQDKVFSLQTVYFANKIISVPNTVYFYKHRNNSAMTSKTKVKRRKRREYKRQANELCAKFAQEHNLHEINAPTYRLFEYKILGMPILKKRIYQSGKIRWYILGVCVIRKKPLL